MNEDLGVSFENDEIFEEDGSLINQDNQIVEGVKKALDSIMQMYLMDLSL